MKFRVDINGLRAYAIISVLFFHFNPTLVPGGYAGVDVFFVISGFLMTGVIFRGLRDNNFSIIKFYMARANRIIPALAVVCFILLIFSWFFISPLEYRALGKHVASSMGFISNIIYWLEAGYFDAASNNKWLLHTWSLSVEWQFYIIYPIFLVLLKKTIPFHHIKRLLIFFTIAGFIFCLYTTYTWPNFSYYLLPARAWEMMVGGIAFLYPLNNLKTRSKKYLECTGVILIVASCFLISKDNLWPGYLALIPVFGTYFVLVANCHGSMLTGNSVIQKIGLWSYSIYLWHWPIVVVGYYFKVDYWEWIGIPLSILLGFFSYKYIESVKLPILTEISLGSIIKFKPIMMIFALGSIGSLIFIKTSYFYALPASIINESMVNSNTDNNAEYTWSTIKQLDKKTKFENLKYKILIIGDSQSGDFVNYLKAIGLNYNTDVISRIVQSRCEVFSLRHKDILSSFEFNENIKNGLISKRECISQISRVRDDNIVKDANVIILSMYWVDSNMEYILKSIENIRSRNKKALIYVIGGKWFNVKVPDSIYFTYKRNISFDNFMFDNIPSGDKVNYLNQREIFTRRVKDYDANYIDLISLLCDKNKCKLKTKKNQPFYYDQDHTTIYGAYFLGEKIKKANFFPKDMFLKN